MKIQMRDKEKDKQSSISVKARIVLIGERIRKQMHEFTTLQETYDHTKAQVHTMKERQKEMCSPEDQNCDLVPKFQNKVQSDFATFHIQLKNFLEKATKYVYEIMEKDAENRQQEIECSGVEVMTYQQLKMLALEVKKKIYDMPHCKNKKTLITKTTKSHI